MLFTMSLCKILAILIMNFCATEDEMFKLKFLFKTKMYIEVIFSSLFDIYSVSLKIIKYVLYSQVFLINCAIGLRHKNNKELIYMATANNRMGIQSKTGL